MVKTKPYIYKSALQKLSITLSFHRLYWQRNIFYCQNLYVDKSFVLPLFTLGLSEIFVSKNVMSNV